MTSDLRVLTFQKVIDSMTWDRLKRDPELHERCVRDHARQHIAADLARCSLGEWVTSEPDPNSDDPLRQTNAVVRYAVAVASKEEASRMALDLSEAEDRGFQAALGAIRSLSEEVLPRLGNEAGARIAVEHALGRVQEARRHRPAADWRPMRTCPRERVEYLFADASTSTQPRRYVPRESELSTAITEPTAALEVSADVLEPIAWRYFGRPPHTGADL